MSTPRHSSPSASRPIIPRVAVLVDTSSSWGRSIHLGINQYARQHGPWQLFVEIRGMDEPLQVPTGWKGDGVIARVATAEMARQLRALRLPVVNVSGIQLPGPGRPFPRVTSDMPAAAQLAVDHLLDRGFRHFGYISLLGLAYVADQQNAFVNAVRRAGHDCALYALRTHSGAEPDWNLDMARLVRWLLELPKPVAIFTWNASSGRLIIHGCQQAGLRVPEEVAVLSGSHDDLLNEVGHVPISGIQAASDQIGLQAAAVLDRLMHRRAVPAAPVLIPPRGVISRQSTETLAIQDRAMVQALSFIRENAARPVRVTEVSRRAGVSRRVLERRFDQLLGRTPADEIRRVHFERAKQLLVETNLPIPDIAEAAGFNSPEYLAYIFKNQTGQSPLNYRKTHR